MAKPGDFLVTDVCPVPQLLTLSLPFVKLLLVAMLLCRIHKAEAQKLDGEQLFENKIRPIIVSKCLPCHNQTVRRGGLSLESRSALLIGGQRGAAITMEKPTESLLSKAVHRTGTIKMPPDGPLKDNQVLAIDQWIKSGATWPSSVPAPSLEHSRSLLWSLRSIRNVAVPKLPGVPTPTNPVDAFIWSKQIRLGLKLAIQTDRRTLMRRASYDLTGMPPNSDSTAQ